MHVYLLVSVETIFCSDSNKLLLESIQKNENTNSLVCVTILCQKRSQVLLSGSSLDSCLRRLEQSVIKASDSLYG